MNRNHLVVFVLVFQFTTSFGQQKLHRISFDKFTDFTSFFQRKTNFYPLVSAHRGGPTKGFPENCTATFENTIRQVPAIIETDIAMTKDSVLVMLHDNTLDRTTTGTGLVSNYTYEELKLLYLKDNDGNVTNFKIETLDEVLAWGRGKVVYTLDVKRGVPFNKIVAAIRKNKAENYSIVITYNANQAAEVSALAPDILLSVSARSKEDVERLENFGVKVENMLAFVGTSFPKEDTMVYMKNRGISCISGTMGNIDKSAVTNGDGIYLDIVKAGVMIISSDRPIEVAKQMELFIIENSLTTKCISHN